MSFFSDEKILNLLGLAPLIIANSQKMHIINSKQIIDTTRYGVWVKTFLDKLLQLWSHTQAVIFFI